jgi:APA family basic amino acid/polyamine antiporter
VPIQGDSEPKTTAGQAQLARELGLLDATMIVVSGIVGGGIFFTPSQVARQLPSSGWILAVWGFGGIIALAGAFTFAELGARKPDAGGHYVYIRDAFGRLPAFLYAWMLFLIISTGALASLALAFAGYLSAFFPIGPAAQKLIGAITIAALSILNIIGLKPGSRTVTLLTIVKIAALALLIGAGLLVSFHTQPLEATTSSSEINRSIPLLLIGFGSALVPVLFTYGGWQQLNFVGEEVRSPEKRIPIALIVGVLVVAAIYMGTNLVYLRALGPEGMAASQRVAADAANVLFGPAASRLLTALVAVSILAFANVVVLVTPRVYFAMARDDVFLPSLAAVHPRFRTPARAIALQGVWAIVLVIIGSIGPLVNGVVFADWIFFGLGAASLFVMRRRQATAPFLTPLYPWLPGFFVLAAAAAVLSAIIAYPLQSLLGTGVLALGALVYYFRNSSRGVSVG